MNTDSSADKDGDRRHAQTPGPACIVRARDTHYPDELLSEVLTRRTGEGVGAAAVAAGAAEAAADARDGGAEQRSLLRVRTGMGIGAMHAPGRAARAHCHITLGRRTGEGKGGASGVAAEAAAGARNGGAEQRPLRARSLLRLRRSAPPARTPSIGSRVRRQAWRRGEARRRRRAREWSACGEADGRWPTGDEAREQPTPDAKDIERLRRSHRAVSGGARRSRPRAGCKAPALAPPRRAFFN